MAARHNRIHTNNIRTIRSALPRFISLMVMSMLGVFVFAGLMATAPDMIGTLDAYLDDHQVYDIKVISDMGLTEADVDAIAALPGITACEGPRSIDMIVSWDGDETVMNVSALPERLNQITLISGRLPERAGEIVTEENFLTKTGLAIGDSILLDSDSLTVSEAVIVGTVDSALYYNNTMISQDRGNTGIGSGKISYFAYMSADSYDTDYYTVIYASADAAAAEVTGEEAYDAIVQEIMDSIEEIRQERQQARYDGLYEEAAEEIYEAQADADEELSEAWDTLEEASDTLTEAWQSLADGRSRLDEAAGQLGEAQETLRSSRDELDTSAETLSAAAEELAENQAQLTAGEAEFQTRTETLAEAEAALSAYEAEIENAGAALSAAEAELSAAEQTLTEQSGTLEAALAAHGLTRESLTETIAALETQIGTIQALIDGASDGSEESGTGDTGTDSAVTGGTDTGDGGTAGSTGGMSEEEIAALRQQLNELQGQLTGLLTLQESSQALASGQTAYEAQKEAYSAACTDLAEKMTSYEAAAAALEAAAGTLSEGEAAYAEGEAAYTEGLAAYEAGETAYSQGFSEYQASLSEYQEGEASYHENMTAYEEGLEDYREGLAEYEDAREEADEAIAEAWEELDGLDMPTWYVYDRTGYSTYTDYIDDSNSIRNLGKIFPVVFFAVAVLVSLISMNRMVEDDRMEIGTLKSLGYEDRTIMSKYLLFSFAATLVGGLLGAVGGLIVIPELIFNIYRILFSLPSLTLTVQPGTTLLGFVLTVLCVCGSSVWTAHQVLKEKPSELMRPKAPKAGGAILAEKIPLLWNHLNFTRKVTVRNIFRYKKRVLVTIGGITGTTALMLTGFGIKDAIKDIPSTQYYEIYQFDGTAYVSGFEMTGDIQETGEEAVLNAEAISETDQSGDVSLTADTFLNMEGITEIACARRITAEIEEIDGFMQVVASADELQEIALFTDTETGEEVTLTPGKVLINEKLSAMTGLGPGDEISFTDVDNHSYTLEISAVVTNYIEHFVYMDAETYESLGETFTPNLVYFHTGDLDEAARDALSEQLLQQDGVLSVSYREKLIDNVDNSLQSLNSVVLILIVLSALLAFVVLYNLSNININERRREIATLKVLGFYDREVDQYITRETVILTLIGILLGLLAGIFLCRIVVNMIEIEKCRFMNQLKPMSYVYAAAMSALFTWIVNIITHFNLMRIDMTGSLKSVE